MAGVSRHGQQNKPHKPGKHAGASARSKHRAAKAGEHRPSVKHHLSSGKQARQQAAAAQRSQKREQLLQQRRNPGAPVAVCLLPLSSNVDVQRAWDNLLAACHTGSVEEPGTPGQACRSAEHDGSMALDAVLKPGMRPCLVAMPGHRRQLQLLPPPVQRDDPLALVALASTADVILLLLPGEEDAVLLDAAGEMALKVLRSLGLPGLLGVVQEPADAGLKERSAAKKSVEAVLTAQVSGNVKVLHGGSPKDAQQVLRHLAEAALATPQWRQQRPVVHVEEAEALFDTAAPDEKGTLVVRGFVRGLGLSVNQALHIQGRGDFLQEQLVPLPAPLPAAGQRKHPAAERGDADMAGVLLPDPAQQDSLQLLNEADLMAAEQTWPTDHELQDAAEVSETAATSRKRHLPAGTSDYQAAWITEAVADDEASDSDHEQEEQPRPGPALSVAEQSMLDLQEDDETDHMQDDDEDAAQQDAAAEKKRRRAEQDDVEFPDEIDTPLDQPARLRFARYRGLKSFRSSPWDPREDLPAEYARSFAFENARRAQKRARQAVERAGAPGDTHGVAAGTYVEVHIAGMPAAAAASVLQQTAALHQGQGMPVLVHGLLQHETKLSVLNFSLRKAASCAAPIPNKAELLLVTGLRSSWARPILSTDEPQADKHKLERFLHAGRQTMATVYGPICHAPLPLLAFRRGEEGHLELAATGSLRSADPDRVVLKKVVLSGYPARVHKKKAVVRWMFHNPDDVRWFRPLELWTKHGRRGRIREPVGTHGAMKCIFDGNIQQSDAVCTSLYKRSYPVWPDALTF